MTKISIGKGVRAIFQPDDDRMDLGDGSNQRMVNVFVYGICRDKKAKSSVDSMRPGNDQPGEVEGFSGLSVVIIFPGIVVSFHLANGSFGLLSRREFDDVGHEEMAWNKRVKDRTEEQILPSIVVAANANQDSILHATLAMVRRICSFPIPS